MDGGTPQSNVGVRQFEMTAIDKLIANGVPAHIAHAFVHIGIPKSGRYMQLRDVVCKMRYEKFFVERSSADYHDKFRVGALVPTVFESKQHRFFTEFAMSDIDAARFAKAFPEFEVISKGRTYNQHAYYANKRYAETELLVSKVYADAAVTGFDATSMIDLGGNDSWHTKRNRHSVHCDNPVLSARDVMRYTVREVFSGSDRSSVCNKSFQECGHKADYAIGVHSTYDITPMQIANAMLGRSVKKFYGVINYIPGIEQRPAGQYEADGMVMTVVKPPRAAPFVRCTFRHDTSLEYVHQLSTLRKYLAVHTQYLFTSKTGEKKVFTYAIDSVRGNSLVFCLYEDVLSLEVNTAVWTPPSSKLYYVSLQFMGLDRMEVDSELFDRLVLEAAGSRNFDEYNIVSLFRYAKSLRQRVSINGVVLSSGYTNTPEQLVYVTIAAYCVAAAHRIESKNYFKRATSQLVSLRGRGFFRDVFTLFGTALLEAILALPVALGDRVGLRELNDRVKKLIASGGSVLVELYKPHAAKGKSFDPRLLEINPSTFVRTADQLVPKPPTGLEFARFEERIRDTFVSCDGFPVRFRSKGLYKYDRDDLPQATNKPVTFQVTTDLTNLKSPEQKRAAAYSSVADVVAGFSRASTGFIIRSNGDRVYRLGSYSVPDGPQLGNEFTSWVPNVENYVVFRGYGPNAVALSPPKVYKKGNCVRFVLFYDDKFRVAADATESSPLPVELYDSAQVMDSVAESATEVKLGSQAQSLSVLVTPETLRSESAFPGGAAEVVDAGGGSQEYYMSGALNSALGPTPPDSSGGLDDVQGTVVSYVSPFEGVELDSVAKSESDVTVSATAGRRDSSGVSQLSAEQVPGLAAVDELVRLCNESERVALSSSKAVCDLAIAVAGNEAPSKVWGQVAQGHPGNVRPVVVDATSDVWRDAVTGDEVNNMAVSDGEVVYDRVTKPPPAGVFVTSDVMKVYTGSAIRDSVVSVKSDGYSCPVTCVDGVAGSGKSYHIIHSAKPGDVVLCETAASLRDVADGLRKVSGWKGHCYTVDSFLMHRQVDRAKVLWIDEAFRLHAGKVFAVLKLLRPSSVYCFGDSKQIPVYPYVPGFDFIYHQFPFLSKQVKLKSWRVPADVAFALSGSRYYSSHVTTMNPVMRSFQPPVQYSAEVLATAAAKSTLLVYTQTCRDDLLQKGLKGVMTIGQAQGKTFDSVTVFRESELGKELYYSAFQTLVAVSRHKKTFTYVTTSGLRGDDSGVAGLIAYARGSTVSEVLLAAHLEPGVKPAADAQALEDRSSAVEGISVVGERSDSLSGFDSVGGYESVAEYDGPVDWSDFADDV